MAPQVSIDPNKKIDENHVVAGEVTLDGSNPTDVTIVGMSAITGVSLALKGTSAPGVGTSVLSYSISGNVLSVYAWKPTSSSDPTLVASTGAEDVGYVVIGN